MNDPHDKTLPAYGGGVFPQHARLLAESAISVEVARARGYVSVDTKTRLDPIGIAKTGRSIPGLLIPIHGVDGTIRTHQYRPDQPRMNKDGKPLKYETPVRSRLVLDVPPPIRAQLADPAIPLWITEGSRKADSAVSAGLCCVGLLGVWGWRGTNASGGKTALACWDSVALNGRDVYVAFDSDVMSKAAVRKALDGLAFFLGSRGARVHLVYLPDGEDGAKVGLDDFLAAGGAVEQLLELARDPGRPHTEDAGERPHPPAAPVEPRTLAEALDIFKRWLHIDDDAPVLAVAATVVANNAQGDPAWLLIVGPPSSGKTETLQATVSLSYVHSAATVTEGALLSGVSKRDRDKDATGGLLRQVGEYGIILCKDFTSVLSQNKDVSAAALAALREVYDGSWDRPVGAGGGRVLSWVGKCGLIGGVTPSIDRFTQVVGALGDRYILLRLPDVDPESMARSALDQGGNQKQMRAELAAAMTGLIAGADVSKVTRPLDDEEIRHLVDLATFTARARTAVERDAYTREVVVLPQPEGTGRIVGQFRRLLGGLEAIGCTPETAWKILHRVAVDCVPRLRVKVMKALMQAEFHTVGLGGNHDPDQLTTARTAEAVGVDWKTAARHLEDLKLLKIAELDIEEGQGGERPTYWHRASKWLHKHWPAQEGEGGSDKKYHHGSEGTGIPHQNRKSEDGHATDTASNTASNRVTSLPHGDSPGSVTASRGIDAVTTPATAQTPSSPPVRASGNGSSPMGPRIPGQNLSPGAAVGEVTTCAGCGTRMKVIIAGQTCHPDLTCEQAAPTLQRS